MLYPPQTLLRLACALWLSGLCAHAAAQDLPAPLAAMREAAEEQADIDPSASSAAESAHLRRPLTPSSGQAREAAASSPAGAAAATTEPGSAAERLHHAMRAIARQEVARDLATPDAAFRGALASGRRAAGGKGNPVDAEKEQREQARGAAVQAQVAKAVGAQRALEAARGNGNGISNGNGINNGNANGRSALSSGPGASGAPRVR